MGCPSASDFAETEKRMREDEKRMDEASKKLAPILADIVRELDQPVSHIDFLLDIIELLGCGWDVPMQALDKAIYGRDRYLYTDGKGNLYAIPR